MTRGASVTGPLTKPRTERGLSEKLPDLLVSRPWLINGDEHRVAKERTMPYHLRSIIRTDLQLVVLDHSAFVQFRDIHIKPEP
jgi:hypothetical protein